MQKKTLVLTVILVILICTGLAGAKPSLVNGTSSGHGVSPILVAGNPTCTDAGCSGTSMKIETTGSYWSTWWLDGTHYITIEASKVMNQTSENSINWTSNTDINCILIKGASGANAYYCTGASKQDDTLMSTPLNPSGMPAAISHIVICYDPAMTYVPEFPAWFIALAGIAGITGLLLVFHRK